MPEHATPRHPPSRRFAIAAIAGLSMVIGAGVVAASTTTVSDPATVRERAVRVTTTTTTSPLVTEGGDLLFPVEPPTLDEHLCEVFNNFGGRSGVYGAGGHQGLDIGAHFSQEVYAVADGILVGEYLDSGSAGLGWTLLSADDVKYRYFHLHSFADGLELGDAVQLGDVIGYVGDTGNATPGGWHLHFEVKPGPDYDPIDPVPLLAIPTTCNLYP